MEAIYKQLMFMRSDCSGIVRQRTVHPDSVGGFRSDMDAVDSGKDHERRQAVWAR